MVKIDQGKTNSIIGLGLFLAVIGFIIYGVMGNPYGQVVALTTPIIIFMITFMGVFGDYVPVIPRGKQVNFDSGVSGTLKGPFIHHEGGRVTGTVVIEKSLVPMDVIEDSRVGGMNYFFDWMTMSTVTINVTGDKEQWMDIPTKISDNFNGAIRFVGNVKGEYITDSKDGIILMELQNTKALTNYAVSSMEHIRAQVANIASQQLMDMDASSQLLEEITSRAKNIRVMTGKSGGSTETVANELAN